MARFDHLSSAPQVFLLSPANCAGERASVLLRDNATAEVAQRLRSGTLTLGEAFSFVSGLYFRGKLAYAREFGQSGTSGSSIFVITPTRGLQEPDAIVSRELLLDFAGTDIASGDARFRQPLARDASAMAAQLSATARVVLLGSIATGKYVDVLAPALGRRLHYPADFVGRGDMSRGGLLLRSVASSVELEYVPLDAGSVRRGARPAKLPPL